MDINSKVPDKTGRTTLLWAACCFPSMGLGHSFDLDTQDPSDPCTAIGLHNARNIFDERCLSIGLAILLQYTWISFGMGEMNRHDVLEGENCNV